MTMKPYLLVLMLAITLTSYTQDDKHISGSIGMGWMDGPAVEVQTEYTTGQLSASAGFITPLSMEVDDRRVIYFKPEFTVRIGQQGALGVGAGYCIHLFKNQQYRGEELPTGFSTSGIMFSLRYLYRIDEGVQVYSGAAATRAVVSLSVGVRATIFKF